MSLERQEAAKEEDLTIIPNCQKDTRMCQNYKIEFRSPNISRATKNKARQIFNNINPNTNILTKDCKLKINCESQENFSPNTVT